MWPDSYIPNAGLNHDVVKQRADMMLQRESVGTVSDPASAALYSVESINQLREKPVFVVQFERDTPEVQGDLIQQIVPPGTSPDSWPQAFHFVQYAGEGQGGGAVRQNLLDQYRRIDKFLYKYLSPLVDDGKIYSESFVDELPFMSAALLPDTKGILSANAKSIETNFEQSFMQKAGVESAALPPVREKAKVLKSSGFGKAPRTKAGKRHPLVAPAHRLNVREDGAIEITISLAEEPNDLHVLLSEVCVHVRATNLGFTIYLPRQPLPAAKIKAFRLPGAGRFVFEIPVDVTVGAIENYQAWSGQPTLIDILSPEELEQAPLLVEEVLDI